ncbi:TolB family protein [Actinopolymorpha pittospori]|uniref:Oligogalacturonide lyase n=1 Tax=Actinopolymorpha pittospori TaxID=648752 RepID=A0A927RBA7_9ACTN|nr:PD40 domain-containing protein [Actinopolymorpha pittospori]MBE1608569.1 oligogalacturonide lyase [Actinopolymorpha pittospori]
MTGVTVRVLTAHPAGSPKPYQTHPTWTTDGDWILFRSDRSGDGSQAYLVHERDGHILQLTEDPRTDTSSLNLDVGRNTLYYFRRSAVPSAADLGHSELVGLDLNRLIPDAIAGAVGARATYERVVTALPGDLHSAGGFAIDADGTAAYWGIGFGPPPQRPAKPQQRRSMIDQQNTNVAEEREAARQRFAVAGRGPGGIRRIDLNTGEISTVIDTDFRMGHVQTNPWVPGEIIYCHETTGDAPQRIWTVRGDGSGNRPLYVETPDEWVTHETVSGADEVMFNLMAHLPYLAEKPSGVAVIDLRSNEMRLLGQARGQGFWHCNGSPDRRWAVADDFLGDITLIDRRSGEMTVLTTDHKMRPDHTHPIFSPDSRRVLIQSGRPSDGQVLDLVIIEVPETLRGRVPALPQPTN